MPDHCTENCPLVPRVEALERENERHTNTHKEIFGRLNKIEQDNAVQSEQYRTILAKLDALAVKVDALESKPGKRWEGIVDKLIGVVIGAVLAFLLAKIGL